jgi:hypothetical protein
MLGTARGQPALGEPTKIGHRAFQRDRAAATGVWGSLPFNELAKVKTRMSESAVWPRGAAGQSHISARSTRSCAARTKSIAISIQMLLLTAMGRLPRGSPGNNGRSMCQRHRTAAAKNGRPNRIAMLAPSPFRPLRNKTVSAKVRQYAQRQKIKGSRIFWVVIEPLSVE